MNDLCFRVGTRVGLGRLINIKHKQLNILKKKLEGQTGKGGK